MWEVVSATGEWAGAIAVVASLLYLARQIKQTNEQSRAAARYSFLNAYAVSNASLSSDEQSAGVFSRGLRGAELNEGESMQFLVQLGQWFNTFCVMFDLHNEGQLPESQWKVVRTDLKALVESPGGLKMWKELIVHNHDQPFVDFVNSMIESNEQTFDFLKVGEGKHA